MDEISCAANLDYSDADQVTDALISVSVPVPVRFNGHICL